MFREMRRYRQKLSDEECVAILTRGSWGVLSLIGDDGYPYGVPLNYVYRDGRLYFHGAKEGHKLDAMRREPKASFCVVDSDELIPEEYTTYFRSVILFGRMNIVTDRERMRDIITVMAERFNPDDTAQHRNEAIEREFPPLCIMELEIEHMSGKEAIELVRSRRKDD